MKCVWRDGNWFAREVRSSSVSTCNFVREEDFIMDCIYILGGLV